MESVGLKNAPFYDFTRRCILRVIDLTPFPDGATKICTSGSVALDSLITTNSEPGGVSIATDGGRAARHSSRHLTLPETGSLDSVPYRRLKFTKKTKLQPLIISSPTSWNPPSDASKSNSHAGRWLGRIVRRRNRKHPAVSSSGLAQCGRRDRAAPCPPKRILLCPGDRTQDALDNDQYLFWKCVD